MAQCPFCGYDDHSHYAIQLHIEELHTEDSPFVVKTSSAPPHPPPSLSFRPSTSPSASSSSSPSSSSSNEPSDDEENPWIKCTRPDCGEYVAIADLDEHYRYHQDLDTIQQQDASPRKASKHPATRQDNRRTDDARNSPRRPRERPQSQRISSSSSSSGSNGSRSILDWLSGGASSGPRRPPPRRRIQQPREPGRLGRRELGPHAYEDRMPDHVLRTLSTGAEITRKIDPDGYLSREVYVANETRGLIPILGDLCSADRTTRATYLCSPHVRHVAKLRCDGNFCGYWNIQMLLSYLQTFQPHRNGRERLLPSILDIQSDIEDAWDAGICSYGRIETGGIRNTRKWIGTHEALAYFTQIGVDVEALTFTPDNKPNSPPSVVALLDHIEAYFMAALDSPRTRHHQTSHITSLPPIYFQRFGHSTTIVGIERKVDGSRNLLVFDPSFATTAPMGRLLAGRAAFAWPENILKAYRRTEVGLSRWSEFEIIVPKASSSTASSTVKSREDDLRRSGKV